MASEPIRPAAVTARRSPPGRTRETRTAIMARKLRWAKRRYRRWKMLTCTMDTTALRATGTTPVRKTNQSGGPARQRRAAKPIAQEAATRVTVAVEGSAAYWDGENIWKQDMLSPHQLIGGSQNASPTCRLCARNTGSHGDHRTKA